MSLLEVRGIHTYYGESYVLQGVSLEVAEGTVVALLGRNGVGKTTTISSIIGFTPPRRGEIHYGDDNIAGRPTYEIARRGIGLVPQGRRIFGSLDVDEHLTLGYASPTCCGWTPERVFELFPRLAERRHQRARTLSGGEQSMLAIGRALLMNPRVLLLDEPTEGLAPVVVELVADAIKVLKAERQSILLVEQDLSLALEIADYVYIMNKGVIVFDGTPAALMLRTDIQARYLGV